MDDMDKIFMVQSLYTDKFIIIYIYIYLGKFRKLSRNLIEKPFRNKRARRECLFLANPVN